MAQPGYLVAFKQGYSEIPRPPPTSVMARSLAASVAESIAVPSGAKYVIFGANGIFYAHCYTTATVPSDTTDGTASEASPAGYELPAEVTTISVIAPAAAIVTAAFYS
jgi:hypothetical protein